MSVEEYYQNLGVVHTDNCATCLGLETQLRRRLMHPKRNIMSWAIVGLAGAIVLAVILSPRVMDMIVGGL